MRGLLQFTLDLFEPASPSVLGSNQSPALIPIELDAPESVAAKPPPHRAGAPAPAPVRFVHPRANREAQLGAARVAYEFTRGRRRTIGFMVDAQGLTVRAPRWVALRDVDAALQEKAGWILRKLAESQQREKRLEAARIEWKDGASFPFLGEPVRVLLDPAAHRLGAPGGAVLLTEGADDAGAGAASKPRTLHLALALARDAEPARIRDAAQAWLMRQARALFIERMDHFAPQLGVRWRKLSLSNAATRWGSASASGAIRLNWRLVHFRLPVIDYVVAHELSHLRVMDHSPRFWDTVESVVPDYAALRRQLKDEVVPRWG